MDTSTADPSDATAQGLIEPVDAALSVDESTLSLLHGMPRLPALAVRTVELPGRSRITAELRLLGTGHQVVLRLDDREWIETLAHVPGRLAHLPGSHREDFPAPGISSREVRCTVTEHSPRGLLKQRRRALEQTASAVGRLHLRGSDGAGAVLCLFASEDRDELMWRAWRSSPERGRLLQTVTLLRVPAEASQLQAG